LSFFPLSRRPLDFFTRVYYTVVSAEKQTVFGKVAQIFVLSSQKRDASPLFSEETVFSPKIQRAAPTVSSRSRSLVSDDRQRRANDAYYADAAY